MALLKHEHIIDKLFGRFDVSDREDDFNDEVYIYSVVLDRSYKAYTVFEPHAFQCFVFLYSVECDSDIMLDTIFRVVETSNGEYDPNVQVLHSSGDFWHTNGSHIVSRCKELSIETQIVTGSLFDKYVNINKNKGDAEI